MDVNKASAARAGAAGDAEARSREIGELEFLVGTACSRAINLLMRSDRDPAELADELAFLGEKAARLSALLRAAGGMDGKPGAGPADGAATDGDGTAGRP
jgi:hypothetical protein